MSEGGDWLENLTEYRAIRAVYGHERPRLDRSRVSSLHLTRSARVTDATLTITLPDFPSEPPQKYVGSNAIGIDLRFGLVSRFHMSGILDDEPAAMSLTCPTADTRRLRVVTELGEVEIVAALASIVNITSFILRPPGSVCG